MWIVETPVPIPNTEVKHNPVDDTGPSRAGKVDQYYHLYRREMSMRCPDCCRDPVVTYLLREGPRDDLYQYKKEIEFRCILFFEEFDPGSG